MTSDAIKPSLTAKQQRFVESYLLDLNATQAAIRAGYSKRTAQEISAQLLAKPHIRAAIDAAKTKRSEETRIDAAWVLKRLLDEAQADLADLYDENGSLKPVHEWPLIWRQGLVQGIEVEELFEGRGEDREHVGTLRKIRLDSRVKRVELIGKHVDVSAFVEQVAVNGLEGLADRIAQAQLEYAEREIVEPARPAIDITPPQLENQPAPNPAAEEPAAVAPTHAAQPIAPRPEPETPPAKKPEPYASPIAWPERQAFCAQDYDDV